ncbi:hypothetical protein UFOVP836_23 [uncultured Caudovirales phage]|uniref:Phage ABA sandwich domain-containing protein n=1 Tax=uncultured Caudovirales phage TaxID=2100421 RepID=A0A6J5P5F3_9CAUD|nr:hypothetical protein UFOVP836_23 [uncultured Caudovirales phage]
MREWTIKESRLIAEGVMEWQVTEHNGRLVRVDGGMVPNWPTEGAGDVLAAIQMDGWRIEHSFWTAASHTFCLRLRNPITKDAAEGTSPKWAEAVMLAVLASVEW